MVSPGQGHSVAGEAAGQPDDALNGVVEHACGQAGSSTMPLRLQIAPIHRRSRSPGRSRCGPTTIPASAALSLMVSRTVRATPSGSTRWDRASISSRAATMWSVAASTFDVDVVAEWRAEHEGQLDLDLGVEVGGGVERRPSSTNM